jgi:thiol:disulfide interchange protein DsbD
MRVVLAFILLFGGWSATAIDLPPSSGDLGDSALPITLDLGGPGQQVEFLPVEEAYKLAIDLDSGPSGQPVIRLYAQIAKGYYLYKHRFAFKLNDTAGQAVALDADFPPAIQRTDEFFGEVEVFYHDLDLTLMPRKAAGQGELMVGYQGCADAGLCYPPEKAWFRLDFDQGTATPIAAPPKRPAQSAAPAAPPDRNLFYILLLALLGGSILNLMPCVFPVLSLKVLGFASTEAHERHVEAWVYTAGVISSFVLIAALLITLQQAGSAVGWGFQLQSPRFVIALAYLFLAMGLSLSGVVEFGGRWMGLGEGLTRRKGPWGSFFTGVLAVVVASPCTAPFMGTALGFAVTQPAPVALAIFAALGAGMALPMLLLTYIPQFRERMPRPGPWMEVFKQFMAFPLYATAIWLLWVAGRQTSVNTMALALAGALLLALALWLWRFQGWHRVLAVASLAAAIALAAAPAAEVGPRSPAPVEGRAQWSEEALDRMLASGQPVFVDVTADWCITCIANEQAVLHSTEVSSAFARNNVTYMVADWTNYDADIAAFLKRYQRNGIPFYVLFSPDPATPPRILPQILRKSTVIEALDAI